MVGHKAVVVKLNLIGSEGRCAEPKVKGVAVFFTEDALAVVAARSDVVEAAFAPSSRFPSHICKVILQNGRYCVKCK